MKRIIISLTLISILFVSVYFILKDKKEEIKQEEVFEEINNIAESTNEVIEDEKSNETMQEPDQVENQKDTMNYEKLKEINNDVVGWIKIEGTTIDYPIMQSKDNPNYYLNKNFYKENSVYGTPYLQETCDMEKSDNLIIYSHHIKGSKMFGALEKYKSMKYWENHKYINILTEFGNKEYEIAYVFTTTANDDGFKYYKFFKAKDENEFNNFINKCKEIQFYNTNVEVQYGKQLVTLSTCEYSRANGRLVVVAVEKNMGVRLRSSSLFC